MPRSILITILLLVLAGCGRPADRWSPEERQLIERLVVLERARTIALADPDLGDVVLDSLAAAWGDSAELDAERVFPTDPRRAQAMHEAVARILEAESDSLTHAPRRDRLAAPIPLD